MSDFDWTPHLKPDEDLLWSGQPTVERTTLSTIWSLLGVSILALTGSLFATFFVFMLSQDGGIRGAVRYLDFETASEQLQVPTTRAGFSIFLLVLTAFFLFFLVKYWREFPNIRYAISSKRALTMRPRNPVKIESLPLSREIMIVRSLGRLDFFIRKGSRLRLAHQFRNIGRAANAAEEAAILAKDGAST